LSNKIKIGKKKGILTKYDPYTTISALLTDERCSYDAMIEYVTIRNLKG